MFLPSLLLPGLTAVLAVAFDVAIVRRWHRNRRPYLLLWAIGIGAFGLGSGAEALFALAGWNPLVFRLYYFCGAILAAAWLGQGTVQLLGRRPWTQISLGALLLLSLFGVFEVAQAQLEPAYMSRRIGGVTATAGTPAAEVLQLAGTTVATPNGALMDVWAQAVADKAGVDYHRITSPPESVPYGFRRGDVFVGTARMLDALELETPPAPSTEGTPIYVVRSDRVLGWVDMLPPLEMNGSAIIRSTSIARSITPIYNIYGTLGLAGGAIYSAWLFFRKRTLYYRMTGNILIATGALAPALGGTLSKAGFPYAVQVSNLIGIVIIYAGFVEATRSDASAPIPQVEGRAPLAHGRTER